MCSRLGLDRYGRPVVVVTTPSLGQEVGQMFRVLGNAFPAAEPGIYFLGAERRRANRDPVPVRRSVERRDKRGRPHRDGRAVLGQRLGVLFVASGT